MTCIEFEDKVSIKLHTIEVFNHFKKCPHLQCFNIYLNEAMWLVPIREEFMVISS